LDLKQYDKAADSLAKAVSLLTKLAEESPTQPQYRAELADAYRWQGKTWLTAENRRLPESERAYRHAIAIDDRLVGEFPAEPSYRIHAAGCRADLGLVVQYRTRIEEAEAVFRESLKLWQHLAADFPTERWYRHEAAYMLDCLGELSWQANQPVKAERLFREALDYYVRLAAENSNIFYSRARLARSYTNLADLLRRNGQVLEVALAQRVVQLYPHNGRFRVVLGSSHYRAGEFANAVQELKQSLALSGANAETFFLLAMASWRQGQKDQARQWYQAAVLRMGFGLPWQWDVGLHQVRREADALMGIDQGLAPAATQTRADDPDYYTRIIAAQPEAAWAYQLRGQIHRRLRNLPQADADARRAFQLLSRNAPSGTEALKELEQAGAMHLHCNSWDMHMLVCSRAIELKDDEPRYYSERGFAYIVLQHYHEAASDYTKVIARDPSRANPYARRGYAYLRSGERDKALADYAKVLELNHDYGGDGWSRRCAKLLGAEVGQWKDDKSFAHFCKAIDLSPKGAEALNILAWALATSPDPSSRDGEKAVRLARKALELAPSDGALWNTLGAAHYRAGNYKEAVAALEKSLSLQGDNGFDCFFLAMACWQLGEKAKARTWFGQAVQWMEKNQPSDEELGRFRAEAAELLGIMDATK
jgi:superkiller protein 3